MGIVDVKQTRWQRRAEWTSLRRWYRAEVARVLRDISQGYVNELDLAKLNNFCMTALMLQAKVEQPAWRAAEKEAELAALLLDEVEDDYTVVDCLHQYALDEEHPNHECCQLCGHVRVK